jgi:hypothetical protein
MFTENCVIKTKEEQKTTTTTVGTVPKSNSKIVERGKIDTPNTQIYK